MKKILGLMIAGVFGLAMAGCAHEKNDTAMQPQGSYTTGQAGSSTQGTMPGDNTQMQNPSSTTNNNGMQPNMPPSDNTNMPNPSNDNGNMPNNNINNPPTNPNTNNTNNP